MKSSDKKLIGIIVLGAIAVYYFSNQQRPAYTGPYQNVPPPPPQSSPNYQVWVDTILKTFGQVSDLWKPGGPFYQQPVQPPTGGGDIWAGNTAPGKVAGPFPLDAPISSPGTKFYSKTKPGLALCKSGPFLPGAGEIRVLKFRSIH